MGVSNRINAGMAVLDFLRPNWAETINSKELTVIHRNQHHLLAQVFGSFEHGQTSIEMSSSLSLAKLGFVPSSLEGTRAYKGEASTMLSRWKTIITSRQECPTAVK